MLKISKLGSKPTVNQVVNFLVNFCKPITANAMKLKINQRIFLVNF